MRRTNWFVIGCLLSVAVILGGCGHKTESHPPQSLPTASVRVQNVESRKRMATE
jgi:hypothetical protein